MSARPSIFLRLLFAIAATFVLACVLVGMRLWSAQHAVPETVRLTELASAPAPLPPPPPPATAPDKTPAPIPEPPPPPVLDLPQLEIEMVPVSIPLRSTQRPKLDLVRPQFDLVLPAPPKPEPVKIVEIPSPPPPKPPVSTPPPVTNPPRLTQALPRASLPPRAVLPPPVNPPPRFAPPRPVPMPSPVAPPAPAAPVDSRVRVAELDQTPRLLNRPSVRFPSKLARTGVREGRVMLEVTINTSGKVSVDRVLNSSHPAHSELAAAARSFASRARYSKPTKNGRPVQAVFHWPLVLKP